MKIGIFDSGFGGLTIYKGIRALLPEYDFIYLGDNARTPYGNRSFEAIFHFSKQCIDILFARDCKIVIIACNTASAKALRTLQQKVLPTEYPDRKVLGIIRPSAEALANLFPADSTWNGSEFGSGSNSESGSKSASEARLNASPAVALWATEGTVKSESYPLELAKFAPHIQLIQQACPMLVPLVEAGEWEGEASEFFIKKYWKNTVEQNPKVKIQALLLACTHYPLLYDKIRAALPSEVKILLQSDIVAPSLVDYLKRHPEVEMALTKSGQQTFLTTDQTEGFDRLAKTFLGQSVVSESIEIA